MNSVPAALNSPRLGRILLWVGVVVLAAGVVAVIVTFVGGKSDKTPVAPSPNFHPSLPDKAVALKNAQGTEIKTYGQLDPAVRSEIRTFIGTVVARKNMDASWPVVGPTLKAGYSRAQWRHAQNIPVVPYPGVDTKHIQFYLDYASTKEILVEVGLSGKPGVSTRPTTFQLGLIPAGQKKWLVDYWMPRWTPPVPQG
jgi:hypothetical protein